MNTIRHLMQATTLGLFALAANAQEATPDHPTRLVSTKTRAEVIVELHAARKAGLIQHGEAQAAHAETTFTSTLTHAQMRAEAAEAQRLGLLCGSGRVQQGRL